MPKQSYRTSPTITELEKRYARRRDPLFFILHPDDATAQPPANTRVPWSEYVTYDSMNADGYFRPPEPYYAPVPGRGNPTRRADKVDWPVIDMTAEQNMSTNTYEDMAGFLAASGQAERDWRATHRLPLPTAALKPLDHAINTDLQTRLMQYPAIGYGGRLRYELQQRPYRQVSPWLHSRDGHADPLLQHLLRVRAQVPYEEPYE